MKKRILSLALALVMVLGLIGFTAPRTNAGWNNNWSYGQNVAHEVADTVRGLGGRISAFLAAAGSYWFSQGGRNIDNDFYYDATNNLTTYADGRTVKGTGGNGYYGGRGSTINLPSGTNGYIADDGNFVYNNGLTYTDGYYTYTWSQNQGRYFRYTSENGTKSYDGLRVRYPSTYGGHDGGGQTTNTNPTPTTTAYSERSYNLSGYDHSYKGVKLYAGRLYNVGQYVNKDQAKRLADFIHDYAGGLVYTDKINTGWMGVNYSQACNFDTANARGSYPLYNPDLNYSTDDYDAACEVLFRLAAENSGMSYVGRTLPKDEINGNTITHYTYYTIDGDGHIYFKDSYNGTYYTFPEAQSTYKSALHSPY